MKIIAIKGFKGSGKNTVADYLVEKYGFNIYSFADPLKKGLVEIFGFTYDEMWGNKKEEINKFWGISGRDVLQKMGTEVFQFEIPKLFPELRDIGRNFWLKRFELWLNQTNHEKIVIPDLRFFHEYEMLTKYETEIWDVTRDDIDKNDLHESEQAQLNIPYDVKIYNIGTIEKLYNQIDFLITKFNSK